MHSEFPNDFVPFAAGFLCRVSTPGQRDEGVSLAVQEEKLTRVILSMNIRLGGGMGRPGFYDDAAQSGDLLTSRIGLQQALADMRAGIINALFVYDQSRLSWSPEHLPNIIRQVAEAGGRIFVLLNGTWIDPEDYMQELSRGLQVHIDRYTRKHNRQLSVTAKRSQAMNGIQPMRSKRPFGYRIVQRLDVLMGKHEAGTEGTYVVEENERRFVELAFALYADGSSLRQVCKRLDEEGAPRLGGSKQWRENTLRGMLINPVYKGEARAYHQKRFVDESRIGVVSPKSGRRLRSKQVMKDAPVGLHICIPCPSIVSPEVWEQAQVRLAENKQTMSARPEFRYLLAGFLVCPHCGSKCKAQCGTKGKSGAYHCPFHAPSVCPAGREVCNNRRYGMAMCERLVAQAVQVLATRTDVISAVIAAYRARVADEKKASGAGNGVEIAALTRRIGEIESRRGEVVMMEGMTREFLEGTLRTLSAQWQESTDRLRTLQEAAVVVQHEACPDVSPDVLARRVSSALVDAEATLMDENVPIEVRRRILRGLVEKAVPIDAEVLPGRKRADHPESVAVHFREILPGVPLMWIICTRTGNFEIGVEASDPPPLVFSIPRLPQPAPVVVREREVAHV